ncbi:MAG: four helix bundle protein [Terrimicrobiaceae bacterium]
MKVEGQKSPSIEERKQAFRIRTRLFAGSIVRFFAALPKNRAEIDIIARQLVRSGTSIAANYREASRARSSDEFIAKIGICIQESDETQLWLELLKEDCGLQLPEIDVLLAESNELLAIFITMSKNTKRNQS